MPIKPMSLSDATIDLCETAIVDILMNAPGWGIRRQVMGRMLANRQFREAHWFRAVQRLTEAGKITATIQKTGPHGTHETVYRLTPRRIA